MLALYTVSGERVKQATVGGRYLLLYLQEEPADLTLRVKPLCGVELYEGNTLVPRYLQSRDKVTLVGGWLPTGYHHCDAEMAFLYGWMVRFSQAGRFRFRVHNSRITLQVLSSDFHPAGDFHLASDFSPASHLPLEILHTRLLHMAAGRKLYLIDLRVPHITAVFDPRSTLSETAILYLKSNATPTARLCVDYEGTRALLTTTDHAGNPIQTDTIFRCEVICE